MRINLYRSILVSITIFFSISGYSQAVFENVDNSIYEYLNRQALRGNIIIDDMIRPLSRNQIAAYLNELDSAYNAKKIPLNEVEHNELRFHIKEYGIGVEEGGVNSLKERWFKKDPRGRLRFLSKIDSTHSFDRSLKNILQPFQFNIEPVIQGSVLTSNDKKTTIYKATGLQIWASLGKRFGLQMYYRDINEEGTGIDFDKKFTPQQGYIPATHPGTKTLNYADVRGTMTYQWKNGLFAVGKEQYVTGYGLNGNLIFSTKAPSFPYIRLTQQILPWLKFEYMHAVLASRLVDTPNSYIATNGGVFGGQRLQMIPKYMVSHAFSLRLKKGLTLMLGESVVYNDRVQLGYVLPLMFYKAWDQYVSGTNINAGSNTQFFVQLSSRNQLKNTHLYTSILVDEFSPSAIFSARRNRTQIGFNVGGSITNFPFLPNLTCSVDYTRINPFVYQNLLPAQEYSNNGYLIGDWMGNNSDRLIIEAKYIPIPRMRVVLRLEQIRKGSAGTTAQQYFQQPQPDFLFGLQQKRWATSGRVSYEWIHNLYFFGQLARQEIKVYSPNFKSNMFYQFSTGCSLGL
jgi:hypothetical protein